MFKLEDGTGRMVRPTHMAIREALEGPTSIVSVVGTEIAISLDVDNDEVDVSDGFGGSTTYERADIKHAMNEFLALMAEA